MSFKIKSSIPSLLGLTILCGSVTELAFFKEAGYSDEDIMRLYNDMKGRIFSRFPDAFWAKSILDSSPNDATYQQSLDWWILNEAPRQVDPTTKKPLNLILKGKKWDLQPWNFPEWNKDNSKVFYMFMGGKDGKVPKVLDNKEDVALYNEADILECPIDGLILAQDDPIKFLKDYGGIPAGTSNRLINDFTTIEKIFHPALHNIYSHITALESEEPEGLVWNKIKDDFFIKIGDRYEFYRNPLEERFVSIDQSITGDTAAIAVTHPELKKDGEIIDVTDMTICIIPNKHRINLDAIKCFVYDLKYKGKLNINHVSFDQFQSEPAQQYLRRSGFEVEHLSVDDQTSPYLNFVQQIKLERFKSGKNIYIKNNLKSLKLSATKTGRPKIDHENGKVENSFGANDKWTTSSLGYNAKDCTDAICASIELRRKYYTSVPGYIYDLDDKQEEYVKPKLKMPKSLSEIGMIIK
jgi:hypothetical protein